MSRYASYFIDENSRSTSITKTIKPETELSSESYWSVSYQLLINKIYNVAKENIEEFNEEHFERPDFEELSIQYQSNMYSSLNHFAKFLYHISEEYLFDKIPEVEFDYDGDISLEWYGKDISRANITFGAGAEIFIAAITYDGTTNSKLFSSKQSADTIQFILKRML